MTSPLRFATDTNRRLLAAKESRGELVRIHAGIYSVDLSTPHEVQIRAHLDEIVRHTGWKGRLAWASALPGQEGQGTVHLVGDRARALDIGGVALRMAGPTRATQGCPVQPWQGKIERPTFWAAIMENLWQRNPDERSNPDRALKCLDQWMERTAARVGETQALVLARDELMQTASHFGRPDAAQATDNAIADWVQHHPGFERYDWNLIRRVMRAGQTIVLGGNRHEQRLAWTCEETEHRAFFEAYFTNFIEGTRLDLHEAYGLTEDPPRRLNAHPKDEHDVAAMLAMIRNNTERLGLSLDEHSADTWIESLLSTHDKLFTHRKKEVMSGHFKDAVNRVGNTVFTAPDQVVGSLRKIHALLLDMPRSAQRATLAHNAFVSVHPFNDGNGRTARLLLNAERELAGHDRLIVPQYWRSDYLDGLKSWSGQGDLAASLAVADRLTQIGRQVPWSSSLAEIGATLERWGAFAEPGERRWGEAGIKDTQTPELLDVLNIHAKTGNKPT